MKVFKRFLAMVLTLAMVATLFAGLTLTASAATQTLSFSFTSCPSGWPSGSSSSANTKTYTVGGTAYTFSLGANVYYNTSKYLMLKSTTYLGLPAIEGYKLTKVVATGNKGASTKTSVAITTNTSGTAVSGGGAKTWSTAGSSYTYNLTGTSANTMYYIYVTAANCQITNLELTYESVGASYTLTASSNGHGTVGTPANGTVSCTPESGYYLSGASVTAGSGLTVSVSGNTISYSGTQTANAVITATFSPKTAATLTYSENGTTHSASIGTKYVGDSVTLAAPATSTLDGGYEFVGWLPSTYAESDTEPSGLLKAGDSYTLSAASNTLYAVYAIKGTGGGVAGEFVLVESAPTDWSGDYVIANTTDAAYVMIADGSVTGTAYSTASGVKTRANAGITYTASGKKLTGVSDDYVFTVSSAGSGKYYIKMKGASSDLYLINNSTTGSSSVSSQTTANSTAAWTFEGLGAGGNAYLVGNAARYLGWNSSYFRAYASSNKDTYKTFLFKSTGGGASYSNYTTTVNLEATYYTLTYSANPAAGGSITCASASGASIEEGTAVSLTAAANQHYTFSGWTVDGVNKGSNATLNLTMDSDKTVVANFTAEPTYTVTITPAAGGTMTASKTTGIYAGETVTLTATPNAHYSFNGWQCTAGGATISGNTFTMPAANVTITGSFTEAAQYTVTFYDKDGHVAATKTYYAGETIPASDVPSIEAPDGFVFKNWYSANYSNTTEPAYTAPAGATVNGNLEFHAVYAELGEGSSAGWEKLTDASTLKAGDQFILVCESKEAYAGAMGNNSYLASVDDESNAIVFTLGGSAGAWTMTTSEGTIGTSAAKSLTTDAGTMTWKISISGGNATIESTNSNYGKIGYNASSPRFLNYTSAQTAIQMYVGGASVEGYTTNPVSTKISVTWMNGTETFDSGKVAFGDPIVPPENDPTKTEAEQEYYTFAGWSEEEGGTVITSFPTASAQLGDKTYYAVYTTTQKLTVTWKNYDNTTLDTDYCKSGDTPAYTGTEPTKPADSSFYYTFSGWTPTVSAITSSITYTATFEQHDRFEMSASLSRNPIKVGKYGQVNATLTDTGVATTAYTPTYTVADTSIATVDATGKITAKAIGSTTITVTYPDACDADGNPLTQTLTLQVIENASVGGYTLITEDMEDWSGDYIFAGRRTGRMADLNNLMIMTPGYGVTIDGDTYDACLEDGGGGSGLGRAENNASWLDLDISGTDATGSILSAYGTDDIVMSSTGDNDAGNYMVLDYIDEIDDSYAFTIELVDDINGYYTIRIKGTNYYLANDNMTSSGNNSLGYAFSVGDSTAPLWKIKMYENPVTTDGYTPPIVSITSVMNDERAIFFNPHQWLSGATDCPGDNTVEQARFRTYGSDSTTGKVGGTAYGGGANYSLYLYGNPNPFKAQIYYKGDQITIAESGKVNANAATAQLTSALTPDIMNYPSWSQVGDPVWTIIENSDGNHMTIGENTGLITTNASSVGSYALVQVAYTVHDNVNNVNHVVSTIAKVDVIAADTTYSTVIYELYSGDDTEVQYTIPNSMTELPLAAYVVNDATNDNSKTGNTVMGGTLSWSIVNQSSSIFGDISVDANGVMHIANVTKDSVVTVKVTGATGDNTAATAATYKVYIKAATYTVDIVPTPDSAGTHDTDTDVYTVPGSADTAHLTYNVKDGNGNGPSSSTFTTAGYAWTISGDAQGALINSNGVLDFSEMDRSEDHTITVVVSRIAATDVNTGVISSGLTDTITVVVKADLVEDVLEAVDDLVIVDYALPVTFNVLTNDNINVEVEVTAGTLPSGVVNNGSGSFTFTPSGWLTTDQTYDYTISGTVNGSAATDTATVTLKTADSVYYEDTYSGIFTFTGNWTDLTDGTAIAEQTSSLDTADIFEYDANYEAYAQYSGGTAKTTTVSKGNASRPSVSFTFAGTGFDVISATTNNGGAVLMQIKDANGQAVKDPVTGRAVSAIYDNFRGYVYCEEEYTRYTLDQVRRCNADGLSNDLGDYYWDNDNKEVAQPVNGNWYSLDYADKTGTGKPNVSGVDGINLYDDYAYAEAEEFFKDYLDPDGSFIIKEHQSHWKPYQKNQAEADEYNTNFYQIPIMKITGLPYGTYTVTLTPTYSSAYDRAGDESYDFIFDGVRIHNPVANRDAEYKYINIADAVDEEGMGSGVIVTCDHVGYEWSDWTFCSKARNTNSATTCNRGSFVQYCTYCGGIANTAYFHVNVTADDTDLGVGGYMGYPSTTMLRYTLTADECENQAAIQAKLDALTGSLTEYWSSNTRAIMTCMNNSNVVIASGEGTTYATLQLKDPITQTIYASAIHSPMITVYADEDHVHTFGDWTHDVDSDPSTHTHTCTGENCSFYETEECVFTEEVTLEPTQTTPGSKTCTCALCGYSYVEEIPALGGHTATFIVPEGATAPAAQTGNSVTMPAAVAAPAAFDAHNYTFVGWIGNTVSDTATEQSFYAPGYEFELNEDMDFYALYTYEGEGSGNTYKMVTSEPANWEGKYIIVNPNKDHAMSNTLKSGSNEINASAITVTDNKVVNPSADLIWELTKNPNNASQYSLYNAAGDVYAGITGTSSTNASLNSTENFFTIEETGTDNVYDIASVTNSARCFSYYGSNETFRTYAKSSNNTGYLFKQAGALTYTTNLAATCKHTNTTTTTVDATCTAAGSTTVTCDDCGEVISVTPIAALGHDYQITSADATGTTYTCSRCGDSYFEPAEFEVTYVLQPGVTVSGNSRSGNAITLPNAASIPATYNAQTYTFVGWANATSADGTTDPTVYAKGEVVNITADTTFYPVYKFSTTTGGGTQEAGYYLATSVPAVNDNFIIAFKNGDSYYALPNGNKSSSASIAGTALTVNNGKATATSAITFTLISNSGNYGVKSTEAANYLGFNSNKISMNGWGDTKYATIAAASDGMFTITSTNNSPRGLSYSGTNFTVSNSGASPVYIFTYTEGGTGGGTTTTTYTFELKSQGDNYTVTLNPATLTMYTEATASLTATLYNNSAVATAEDISFSSSNDNIVMVDENTGYVLAGETAGNATITVEVLAADGEIYTATCAVTVKEQSDNLTVNYIGSASGNVYNWGTRGTTATFLTEMADNYYTGSYSYDTLSALSGNSGTGTDFYSSALGTAIHNMLVAKQKSTTSYDGTKTLYKYTDCVESDTAHTSSYYSATQITSTWDSAATWNREHTWPKSKALSGTQGDQNDIMMLRPTSVNENGDRGNLAYGESSGYYDPNSEGQQLHGDVARLMLQHLMRWGNTSKFYGTGGVMESRAILLKWLAEDPVDTWEMGRNDAVERITGVRNVFVDYPELAFILLGAEVPANYTTPSKAGIVAEATYSATRPSNYEPVTEAAAPKSIVPAATEEAAPAERPATRSIAAGTFNGIAIIDGKGASNVADDQAAYGPEHGVYLAPGQGIVFSLVSDVAITSQDLQIGAKAVNGTATAIDVASISNGTESTGIKYLLEDKAIASATEMYYELDTTQMGWNGTESSVLVIYNSGSGVLDVTNIRYSTVNGNTLTLRINEVEVQEAIKMIQIVYGEPITDPDPIEPTEPTDLALNFASAELVLNSDIAINFNVDEAVMDSADGVYAVFTKALYNENGEITGYAEETVTEATYNEESGKYSFRFTGINPAEMGSAVTAQLFGYRDGELISGKAINYSVLTYINNMYGKVDNAEFRALLADLAAYGEAAQNYVSYNTANLVTADVADGLMAYATAEAPELNSCTAISGEGDINFTGAYLSLREKVTVCYMIDASEYAGNVADLELRIFDGARQIGTATFAEVGGKYIASFSGLNALQMRTVITAEVYDGDTCVSNTLDYSIESYAASKAAGNDALAALVNAMMNFGISAETYFAK